MTTTITVITRESTDRYQASSTYGRLLDIIGIDEMPELFYSFLHESSITSNFGLYCNPSNCVHSPIVVTDADDPDSLIFEIEVKGPHKLVLSENQMYTA